MDCAKEKAYAIVEEFRTQWNCGSIINLLELSFLLFEGVEEEVPDEPYEIDFGKAAIGSDITIIVKALMVHGSLKVTEILQKEGISAEVIDLRTLVPLDEETIVKSAKKTGRVR